LKEVITQEEAFQIKKRLFENPLPEERPAPLLKAKVKAWLEGRGLSVGDKGDYLLFQLDFSFIAIFSYVIPLPSRTVSCLSMQAYIMGKFAAEFLDDRDLAELNRRILVGGVVRGEERHLLLVHNVMAEGMTKETFNKALDLFGEGIESVDRQVARLMALQKG